MPLYEFRCAGGHVEEHLAPALATSARCSVCGSEAGRVAFSRFVSRRAAPRGIDLKQALEADAEVKHGYARAGVEPPDIAGSALRHVTGMRRRGQR